MTPDERTEMSALRERLQAIEDQLTEQQEERAAVGYDLQQLELQYNRMEERLARNKREFSDIITTYASQRGSLIHFDALYHALQDLEITWED